MRRIIQANIDSSETDTTERAPETRLLAAEEESLKSCSIGPMPGEPQRRRMEQSTTSIIPFLSNEVFEATDIRVMSAAYNLAIEAISLSGRPNKIVGEIMADRIIALTKQGEHNPDRLCNAALAACGLTSIA